MSILLGIKNKIFNATYEWKNCSIKYFSLFLQLESKERLDVIWIVKYEIFLFYVIYRLYII